MSGYWRHLGGGGDEFAESITDEQSNAARTADEARAAAARAEREKMKESGWRECEARHACSACGGKSEGISTWWRRTPASPALAEILTRRRVVVYACAPCVDGAVAAAQAQDVEDLRRELPKTLAGALRGEASAIAKLRAKYPTES
jgi:hypothetical protein